MMLGGRALTSGELARAANVSPQSASMHLAQLRSGGLATIAQEGRYRYYRLASPEAAHLMEALGVIATPTRHSKGEGEPIRFARTCYDHLAGELAVRLTAKLEREGWVVAAAGCEYRVPPAGERFLAAWGIDFASMRRSRRIFARRCLDWTERRDHIAGALGAALLQSFLDRKWLRRDRDSRVVFLTTSGRRNLEPLIGGSHSSAGTARAPMGSPR